MVEYCSYQECEKEIDSRSCVYDKEKDRYFCDPACRAMWAVENGPDNLRLKMIEMGIERLISKDFVIEANDES